MEQSKLLTEYEKEFESEVAKQYISIEDLKKCGVSEKTLASELFLRKIYGDEIVKRTLSDIIDERQEKRISKVGEDEKNIDVELRNIWNDIENSEFDKNMENYTS